MELIARFRTLCSHETFIYLSAKKSYIFFSFVAKTCTADSEPAQLQDHPKQEGRGPQTDKYLPQSPFTIFLHDDILLWYLPGS
jgi:hypothetical protein